MILKQHDVGRREERGKRKRRSKERGRERDMERDMDMEERVLIIAVGVCVTGTGSPNHVFAQYARVENSNQSSTGI